MIEAELKGADDLVAALKQIDDQLEALIMDGLAEVGEEMAADMNREDTLNVAHDTFIIQRRKGAVAVGPSKAGGRAAITRFHEFGTAHHGATPLIRPIADKADAVVKKKITKRLKEAIRIASR
jgi:hypothetical protein